MLHIPKSEFELEVLTFYKFQSLSPNEIQALEQILVSAARELGVSGLVILGPEGLNATVAARADGSLRSIDECGLGIEPTSPATELTRRAARHLSGGLTSTFDNIKVSRVSRGEKVPFNGFVVKVRNEIVTLGRPDIRQTSSSDGHLSPEAWHEAIQKPDAQVIDTRNDYETAIGTFRGALKPQIEEFQEFPEWVDSATDIDRSKPTFIFCTGGIRCEKAIHVMREKGFKDVYQLDGGILNYIEKIPRSGQTPSLWEGECFVFDNRVAVDGDGRASQKFGACPHCGQPSEHSIFCVRCDEPALLCDACYDEQIQASGTTCSKNCAHHWSLKPGVKGRPQKRAQDGTTVKA